MMNERALNPQLGGEQFIHSFVAFLTNKQMEDWKIAGKKVAIQTITDPKVQKCPYSS